MMLFNVNDAMMMLPLLIAADEAQMDGHLELIRVECKCNSHHFHSQLQAFDLLSLPLSFSLSRSSCVSD